MENGNRGFIPVVDFVESKKHDKYSDKIVEACSDLGVDSKYESKIYEHFANMQNNGKLNGRSTSTYLAAITHVILKEDGIEKFKKIGEVYGVRGKILLRTVNEVQEKNGVSVSSDGYELSKKLVDEILENYPTTNKENFKLIGDLAKDYLKMYEDSKTVSGNRVTHASAAIWIASEKYNYNLNQELLGDSSGVSSLSIRNSVKKIKPTIKI